MRHHGLGCWRHARPPRGSDLMCRRRCAAFDRLPSYLRRSRDAPFFRRLGALAVQDGGAGTLLATSGQSGLGPKSIVDSRPSAIQAPGTKVVVDRLAARKLVGQVAPGASRAQCIEDAVDDLAQVHLPRTSSRLGWRKQWLQRLPLRIRKIAGVRLSLHTQSLPQSLPLFRHTLSAGWSAKTLDKSPSHLFAPYPDGADLHPRMVLVRFARHSSGLLAALRSAVDDLRLALPN